MKADPAATECTFCSSAPDTFTKINHVLGHKASVVTQEVEIIQSMSSDHSGVKLEISLKNI